MSEITNSAIQGPIIGSKLTQVRWYISDMPNFAGGSYKSILQIRHRWRRRQKPRQSQTGTNHLLPNNSKPSTVFEAVTPTSRFPVKTRRVSEAEIHFVDPRPKTRRRLPGSISGVFEDDRRQYESSSENHARISHSFAPVPCPKSRGFRSDTMKMRYPVMNFGGQIIYGRTADEVEKAASEILRLVDSKRKAMDQLSLGLDIEWRPTFNRGTPPGRAAVMQLCGDLNHCYVLHIIHTGIPQSLRSLLEDPTVIKVGVGIDNDAVKVFQDHNVSIRSVVDLSSLAKRKLGQLRQWSLSSLVEVLTCKELPKPKKIRLGNWEADVLSKAQLQYAATDAFASWYLYEVLQSFPDPCEQHSTS